jgi:hypothetical protein
MLIAGSKFLKGGIMRKVSWVVMSLFVIAGLTVVFFGVTPIINSKPHHHHTQNIANLPPLLTDGASNPSDIPDSIAYEILFNSVADGANVNEVERLRARHFAEKTKLSSENVDLLRLSANRFRVNVSVLDTQAAELKNKHWPKPSSDVLEQLASLQRQKQAILSAAISSLTGQLGDDDKEKIKERILEIRWSTELELIYNSQRYDQAG